MNITVKRKFRRILTFVLAVVMMVSIPLTASAATTEVDLGVGRALLITGQIDYYVRGYVTHFYNNEQALSISSIASYIYNNGLTSVNEVWFKAYDAQHTNYVEYHEDIDAIPQNSEALVEVDWHSHCASLTGKSHIYPKNHNDNMAVTEILAGMNDMGLAGWLSYWFQTSRQDQFTC